MTTLAFLVLAGLGLVVAWSFMKRHRDRDRWPNNLINSSNTPSRTDSSSDTDWSPSSDALIVAGSVTLSDLASNRADASSDTTEGTSSAWSEHGATGSWGDGDTRDSARDSDGDGGNEGGGSDGDSRD